jgi:hypothetical protein
MRTSRAIPSPLPASLTWLTAALLSLGCADQSNPVLPSTGVPGTTSSAIRVDGSATSEAGWVTSDAQPDTFAEDEVGSDAFLGTPCDLLVQNCPSALEACYPLAGAGYSQPKGDVGVQGDCDLIRDVAFCDRGLACIPRVPGETPGVCLRICSLENPTLYCGQGNSCVPSSQFPSKVGYCRFA